MRTAAVLPLCLLLLMNTAAADDVEFEGVPTLRIEVHEGAVETLPLTVLKAREFAVRITRTPNGYLWASRKNTPLTKQESGAYVTYVATNGSGYIRVLSPAMRQLRNQLPAQQRESEFVYMEHMVHQLGALTYFGR